jgi:hypothetical protein
MTIRPGKLHLWTVRTDELNDATIASRVAGILTADERNEARRFHRARTRQQFIIARASAGWRSLGTLRSLPVTGALTGAKIVTGRSRKCAKARSLGFGLSLSDVGFELVLRLVEFGGARIVPAA